MACFINMILLCVVGLCIICVTVSSYRPSYQCDSTSLFPNRTQPPGLHNPQKLWWAKEITPYLHVAGRLTERQMKYTQEAGFKSILSLFSYGEKDIGDFGGEALPNTRQQQDIATSIGITFAYALDLNDDWCSVKGVDKFSQVLSRLEFPVLLSCDRTYTCTFVTLMHFANLSRCNVNFKPKITSEKFYDISAVMGLDFTEDFTKQVVSEITGEKMIQKPVVPDAVPSGWLEYWLCHPVYKNWYSGGQVTPSQIIVLELAGFKAVINVRCGVKFGNVSSQEEVNLLNIKPNTGTYGDQNHLPRQSIRRLEETRIEPTRPNSYIGKASLINYERQNRAEFGDKVGYNEDMEKQAFQKSSIKYYHFAWPSKFMKNEHAITYFEDNLRKIAEIGKEGPVLIKCRSGKRAAYLAIAAAAIQHNKTLDWALTRSRELGFEVSQTTVPFIYQSYFKELTRNDELSASSLDDFLDFLYQL